MIRIISKKDWIPEDDILSYILKHAKDYLSSGHSWIKFDIDNNTVESSEGFKSFEYGKLRKLKPDHASIFVV